MTTYYELLQVTRDASPEVIGAAYKSLTQRYHPDRNPNDRENCERTMILLNRAYEVLSDPAKRAEYDQWIADENTANEAKPSAPQPASSTTAETSRGTNKESATVKRQGMRLATWAIYVGMPLGGVLQALLPFTLPTLPESEVSYSIVTAAIGIYGVVVASLMSQRSMLGWKLNFASLLLFILWITAYRPLVQQSPVPQFIAGVVFALLVYVPICIYWLKRKHVFDGNKSTPFPKDWRQAWLICPFVFVGAIVSIAGLRGTLLEMAQRDAAVLQQSPQAQSTTTPTQPPVDSKSSQVEIKRKMDERAAQLYRFYPFLDSHSPQANSTAIYAVIGRRDDLIYHGVDPVTALDTAMREVGSQYAGSTAPAPPQSDSAAGFTSPSDAATTSQPAEFDDRPKWERLLCPKPYKYVRYDDLCCMNGDHNERCVKPNDE